MRDRTLGREAALIRLYALDLARADDGLDERGHSSPQAGTPVIQAGTRRGIFETVSNGDWNSNVKYFSGERLPNHVRP